MLTSSRSGSDAGSLRHFSMVSKLLPTEPISSSDSNASIRKSLLDKSTMTISESNSNVNLCAPWDK